jgi:hypothetical protein
MLPPAGEREERHGLAEGLAKRARLHGWIAQMLPVPCGPAVTSAEPAVLADRHEHRAALLAASAFGDVAAVLPAVGWRAGRCCCAFSSMAPAPGADRRGAGGNWTLLTGHGHVLVEIAATPRPGSATSAQLLT